jgi:hypothetical protein
VTTRGHAVATRRHRAAIVLHDLATRRHAVVNVLHDVTTRRHVVAIASPDVAIDRHEPAIDDRFANPRRPGFAHLRTIFEKCGRLSFKRVPRQ